MCIDIGTAYVDGMLIINDMMKDIAQEISSVQ